MGIDIIAWLKTKEEFFAAYESGFCNKRFNGEDLILYTLRNTKHDVYEMCNFLLDKGADASAKTKDGDTTLHLLFGRRNHDLEETFRLAQRLLDGGADINGLNKKNESAFVWVMNMGFTDEQLAPLYDILFKYPQTALRTKSAWNITPLELAKKIPYRAELAKRMEAASFGW